jgi:hypothetical protein
MNYYENVIEIKNSNKDRNESIIYDDICSDNSYYKEASIKFKKNFHQLHCQLLSNHVLLLISPVKQEQINIEPPIFIYYDIINDNISQRIIKNNRNKVNFFLN